MTIEINATLANIHELALDQAIKAAIPNKCYGLSTYGINRSISIWLDDSASGSDQTTAQSTAAAHDPVFLSVDKTSIQANGSDMATITIQAPKQGGAPVTLTITTTSPNNSSTSQDDLITLINGIGTETLTALDPATITITVKNATNRSTYTLTIVAR